MFWNNFVSLCNKQGMSPNVVAAKLGFGNSAVTYQKNGTVPNGKSLAKIAEFFGIGADELLGTKKEPVPQYDPTTAALVEAFSKMNDEQRKKLMEIVSQMENEQENRISSVRCSVGFVYDPVIRAFRRNGRERRALQKRRIPLSPRISGA